MLFRRDGRDGLASSAKYVLSPFLGNMEDGSIGSQPLQQGCDHLHFLQMPILRKIVQIAKFLVQPELVEAQIKLQLAACFNRCRNSLKNSRNRLDRWVF